MSLPAQLPDSQTHRLAYFKGAPDSHKHIVVPAFVADEVEELREFVKFLYPPKGQDKFRLCRPDILEPRWTVFSKSRNETYTRGLDPLEAVRNARARFSAETSESERVLTPFTICS